MTEKIADVREGAISNGAIWSVVETCTAVVSACLPTLRSLIDQPPDRASARERYEASYIPKHTNNPDNSKMSMVEPTGSQDIF